MSLKNIITTTSGQLFSGKETIQISGICTDSRKVGPGDLFVALQGERFDGHKFLHQTAENGALAALVSQIPSHSQQAPLPNIAIVLVEDTLTALGDLGRTYRQRFSLPLIGITGSNGKTTTKEMIAHLLSQQGPTLSTYGNYNNAIGVPYNLFRLNSDFQYSVIEMGANHPGEIAYLAGLCLPDLGVITNIGPAHLQGFGSLRGVKEAKEELALALGEKTLILNGDDPLCREIGRAHKGKVITFGLKSRVDILGKILRVGQQGTWVEIEEQPFLLPLLGKTNVYNCLSAIAVARELGLPATIYTNWQTFTPPALRLEKIEERGITFIKDCYNSNPQSASAAISILADYPCKGRKILVLGDMLELGPDSSLFHWKLGRRAFQAGIHLSLSLGKEALYFHQSLEKLGGKSLHLASHQEAIQILKEILEPGDCVLLKASRGMNLESLWKGWKAA